MIDVPIYYKHPMFNTPGRDLKRSRESLKRSGNWMAVASFLNTEVIEWLEPYEWKLDFGTIYHVFKFEDDAVATMFKLTWGGK